MKGAPQPVVTAPASTQQGSPAHGSNDSGLKTTQESEQHGPTDSHPQSESDVQSVSACTEGAFSSFSYITALSEAVGLAIILLNFTSLKTCIRMVNPGL